MLQKSGLFISYLNDGIVLRNVSIFLSLSSYDILVIAVSHDGKYVVSAGEDNELFLWNAETQAPILQNAGKDAGRYWEPKVAKRHKGPIRSVAFNPTDSNFFVSASNDGTLRFWETETDELVWKTSPQREAKTSPKQKNPPIYEIYSVAFRTDGESMASGGRDGKIYLWDASKERTTVEQKPTAEWPAHKEQILAVAFDPDDRYLASASGDNHVAIWETKTLDAKTKKPKYRLKHDADVWAIAFHPEKPYLASGSANGEIRLWSLETGKEIKLLTKLTNAVVSVTFSPNGNQLASGSFDRTIRLWDTSDNDLSKDKPKAPPLLGHTQNVWAVQYMPDGRSLVSGSADLSLRWWPSNWTTWHRIACDRLENHPLFNNPPKNLKSEKENADVFKESRSACEDYFLKK